MSVVDNPRVTCPTLSASDAAAFLGIATQTLAVWRVTNRYQLPFIRVGRRIRYRVTDLEAFLAGNTNGTIEGK